MGGERKGAKAMAKKSIRKEIAALKAALKKRDVSVKMLVLFGSHARGMATMHSDVDICVVCDTKKTKDPKDLQSRLNCDMGLAGINMDVIVSTYKDFRQNMISPILHEIRTFGKVL
jgi:predicted nucleotidyltransferase